MSDKSRREREKEFRRDEILKSAEEVFGIKGFDKASMDEIASKADFTKRTLYKYFPNKVDLFFAVALKGFMLMGAPMSDKSENSTAYEKLHKGLMAKFQMLKSNPGMFKIINEVGYVRKKDAISPNMDAWYKYDDILFKGIEELIREGQADGSINADLDAKTTAFSCGFLTSGMFKNLAESGQTFAEHFSLDLDKFSRYTIELLLSSIKS